MKSLFLNVEHIFVSWDINILYFKIFTTFKCHTEAINLLIFSNDVNTEGIVSISVCGGYVFWA